ncbi:MAG: hypothetical protein IIU70_07095, partial [Anaerotignum sp.]|nr:hypothetical protein [Anaerotignum sp.]
CMDDLRQATHVRFVAHRDYTGALKIIPPIRDNGPRWVTEKMPFSGDSASENIGFSCRKDKD